MGPQHPLYPSSQHLAQRRLGRTPPAAVPVELVFPMAAPAWADTVTGMGQLAPFRLGAVPEAQVSPALGVEPLLVLVRQLYEGLEEVALLVPV